ncbi:prepilin peptidase [Fimbriiglobus ruber]|uniref:Leader peptidase (Prepilin peptidase) n=1 Tax=Fimbriiglobus ruber TaxID=1908690 RepID=A0A225DQN2_9BACT|nr:A24 family peptidase [Fimbriiglobus ruber]OWK43403.1 Leader peptidase (Prepilin peptidase) [Fimbriiglobus ruber]
MNILLTYGPPAFWCAWVFLFGLGVGSFLNVLIARLPYDKSPIWPGSRCGACLQPLKLRDNIPILGYLRLRGRCRMCGATFSSRYLWVEVGTGVAFLSLFVIEVMTQAIGGPEFLRPWHYAPGLKFSWFSASPPPQDWLLFASHAFLLSVLIVAALIDAEHRVIPTQVTYIGTAVGLLASTLLAWPWPSDPAVLAQIQPNAPWFLPNILGKLPTGMTLWPFWGPLPTWTPAGSWQLGLCNALIGAAVGTALVRGIKFLFEIGIGKEALGLGDADLMMMAGAFLGWQVVLIGFFAGGLAGLLLKIPSVIYSLITGRTVVSELSFGPGLALGIVATWFAWPWVSSSAVVLFEPVVLGVLVIAIGGGLLVAGILLRRK